MASLALDFAARALTTALARPIAAPAQRADCRWQTADLQSANPEVYAPNELPPLRALINAEASKYRHSRGRAFSEHLHGVAGLLERWGAPALAVEAGLCHSLYSTQQYPYGLYAYSERAEVRSLLGAPLERLVFLFCSHDRVDLYGQAVELARAGRVLPEQGLTLRNALTREQADMPREMVALLLLIHAADIVEQMSGFSFDFVFAVLYVIQPCLEPPRCFAELAAGGKSPDAIRIRINASRGTVGLIPILGFNRDLLGLRARIVLALRHRGGLSRRATTSLCDLFERYPYVLDLAWILANRGEFDGQARAQELLDKSRALMQTWGVPWLKTPMERDPDFVRELALANQRSET